MNDEQKHDAAMLIAAEMAILLTGNRTLRTALHAADKAATEATADVKTLRGEITMLKARNEYLVGQNRQLCDEVEALAKREERRRKRTKA
jgi:hypothetical protein